MEITNENLLSYQNKKVLSKKYSSWFLKLANEFGITRIDEYTIKDLVQQINFLKSESEKHLYITYSKDKKLVEYQALIKREERFKDCLNLWEWDVYQNEKVMDLKHVNRCKDRFCPNCRKIKLSLLTYKLMPEVQLLLQDGYLPFLMTLTVVNVGNGELNNELDHMQKAYRKFYKWLSLKNGNGYKNRLFRIDGSMRTIEVTKSKNNTYHPHYHCMVLIHKDFIDEDDFKLQHKAYKKNGKDVYISNADIQISQLWTASYNNKSHKDITENFDWKENLICDFRPITDSGGFFEVLKYTFKDTDIQNYQDFKEYYIALNRRRSYQGYGNLYNINREIQDDLLDDDFIDSLKEKESPITKYVKGLTKLITDYHDYKKITRFKSNKFEDSFD